jgi:hypothetical protein
MKRYRYQFASSRPGATMVECVVAASILIVAMSTVTSMAFRGNRIWIDVAHERIAINELTNTLEELTQLPIDEIDDALNALRPSSAAESSLNQPTITGQRIQDKLGDRIELRLQWQTIPTPRSVHLSGWVDLSESTP